MTGFLRSYFSYPVLATEGATQRARTFFRIAFGFLVVSSTFLLLLTVMEPDTLHRRLISIGLAAAVILPLIEVNRRGHTRIAGVLLMMGLVAVVTRASLTSGGIATPNGYFMIFFVALGGLLFSSRGVVVCAILLSLLGLLLLALGEAGLLPQSELNFTPLTTWMYAVLCMGGSLLVQREVAASIGRSLRRAEEEIEAHDKARQRLRLALNAGELGVWVLDTGSRRFQADSSLFELYGIPVTADHNIGYENWLDLIHPEDRANAHAAVQEIIAGKEDVRVEFRIVLPDGSIRHVEGTGALELDEGNAARTVVGLNRDVTERKRADQERERLVHDLGERVKELKLLHAAARLMQNRALNRQALFEQLVALMPAGWQFPEFCKARLTCGHLVVATPGWGPARWTLDVSFSTSDSSGRIEVAYLDTLPAGKADPFLEEERVLLQSLAEMLVNHLELRKHREDLEALVATRTREMREARDEAERANRAKGDFLASMSHEIRTPMNAILGYAQLLRRESGLAVIQRERLDAILSSGDHLLTLINNVLDMSKIEAGKTTLEVAPLDLHLLLRDLQRMFAALAAAKSLELSVQGIANLPRMVCADAGRVRQVLINLVSNALKFTHKGGITLHASCSSTPEAHRVSIVVADSGPGIPPEDLARVFEVFEQSSAGAQAGGTGLGLPIARELARLMEGDITADSQPGQGSTFTFVFQAGVVDELAAGQARRAVGIRRAGPTPKILIVDDRPDNLTIADAMLCGVGYQTRLAMRGDEALVAVAEWQPDLLLMDIRMPGMSGIEVVRRLRAGGNQVPVVIFTASGLDQAAAEARAAGANDVLYKPASETTLMQILGRQLNLEYIYEEIAPATEGQPEERSGETTILRGLDAGVPKRLLEELLTAAVQARAARIEQLATELAAHAPIAADRIRKLAREFRYEEIIDSVRAAADSA